MENVRLSRSLCQTVGDVLSDTGSHATLEALFHSAGAPGDPPDLAHHSKWKEWLFRAGQDREVDSLAVLGNVLEEFMDIAPEASGGSPEDWRVQRTRVVASLEENGLRYFRFGRVLPQGQGGVSPEVTAPGDGPTGKDPEKPTNHLEVVQILVSGLRRAMHPLANRRKNASTLTFSNEYDVQDLLHALLRPWVNDIRPEEHTPSYAGSSARMDFLLPAYNLALELKFVRDRPHATRIGDELTIDVVGVAVPGGAPWEAASAVSKLECTPNWRRDGTGLAADAQDLAGTVCHANLAGVTGDSACRFCGNREV